MHFENFTFNGDEDTDKTGLDNNGDIYDHFKKSSFASF